MAVNMDQFKAISTESLQARKESILSAAQLGRDEVHVLNQVLHARNIEALGKKRLAEFIEANTPKTEVELQELSSDDVSELKI